MSHRWSRPRTFAWLTAVVGAGLFTLGAVTIPTVGAQTCATCHQEAYEVWKAGPHATSASRLDRRDAEDARCARCHAPERDSGLAGVQCESCHGPGRYYFSEYVMRDAELARLVGLQDVDESTCRRCHDASSPSLRPFEFAEKAARIRHWVDAPATDADASP